MIPTIVLHEMAQLNICSLQPICVYNTVDKTCYVCPMTEQTFHKGLDTKLKFLKDNVRPRYYLESDW